MPVNFPNLISVYESLSFSLFSEWIRCPTVRANFTTCNLVPILSCLFRQFFPFLVIFLISSLRILYNVFALSQSLPRIQPFPYPPNFLSYSPLNTSIKSNLCYPFNLRCVTWHCSTVNPSRARIKGCHGACLIDVFKGPDVYFPDFYLLLFCL